MTPPTDPLHNEDVAHEHSDINVRAIVVFLIGLAVVTALAAAASLGVFKLLDRMAEKNDPQLSPLAAPSGQLPPEPRLLTNEPAALDKHRAEESKHLESGEWVDQAGGIGRIPIADAKKALLHKGLPVRAGEPIDPRLGTRAASMADGSSGRLATAKPAARPAAQPPAPVPHPPAPDAPRPGHKPGGGH